MELSQFPAPHLLALMDATVKVEFACEGKFGFCWEEYTANDLTTNQP